MPGSSKLKLTTRPYTTMNKKEGERGTVFVNSCAASSGTALSNGPAWHRALNCTLFTQKTGNGSLLQKGQLDIGELHHIVYFTLHIIDLSDCRHWNKPISSILPLSGRDQYRAWEMEAVSL